MRGLCGVGYRAVCVLAAKRRRRHGKNGAWSAACSGASNGENADGKADLLDRRAEGIGDSDGSSDCGDALRGVWTATGDGGERNRLRSGLRGFGGPAECAAAYGGRGG